MPSDSAAPAPEFRPYRRFVSWFVLAFVALGSAYLLISVAVTLYRRQHAVPLGSLVGAQPSAADAQSCFDELSDVVDGLQKHLESSHRLLGHYDAADVQGWAEAGSYWRGQWKAVGERCGFEHRRGIKYWEELAVLHEELRRAEASYTKEILRFGREEAPRLDRLRERLARVGKRLGVEPQ